MPVVTIQSLPLDDKIQTDRLLAKIVNDLAAALGTETSNVWANFTPMVSVREGDLSNHTASYHPIVTVLANPRSEKLVKQGLEAVARAVAVELSVELKKVWVHWIELKNGFVFAEGEVK